MLKRAPLCLLLLIGACASSQEDSQQLMVAEAPTATEARTPVDDPQRTEVAIEPISTQAADATLLVMLGTGTPNPDPERSGPAVAVIAGGRPYLVDCGPGVVRRAAAAHLAGVSALDMPNLSRLFVTTFTPTTRPATPTSS